MCIVSYWWGNRSSGGWDPCRWSTPHTPSPRKKGTLHGVDLLSPLYPSASVLRPMKWDSTPLGTAGWEPKGWNRLRSQ